MRHLIVRTFELTLIIGLCFGAIYSQSTSTSTPARYATVNAVLENTSNKSVLIWATGNVPKTLADIEREQIWSDKIAFFWGKNRAVAPTGTITLINEDGTIFGPWRASGTAGEGGVPSANWEVRPNILIPAGRYQVIDSDPSTWAQNAQTGGKGFVVIKGLN